MAVLPRAANRHTAHDGFAADKRAPHVSDFQILNKPKICFVMQKK
jgi:hypothetical protein